MAGKTTFGILYTAFVLIAILVGCDSDGGLQFTADIVMTQGEQIMNGRLYYNEGNYRVEMGEDSVIFLLIVDQDAGLTRVFVPQRKTYLEMPIDDPRSIAGDPIQSVKSAATTGESRILETDTLDGHVCDKIRISKDGDDLFTQWVSRKLNFPIKIVNHTDKDKTFELVNIREEEPDKSLFIIPAGYTLMGEAEQGPAIGEPIQSDKMVTKTMKAPIKQSVSKWLELRVELDPAKKVKVRFKNMRNSKAVCAFVFYKDGQPLEKDEMGPQGYGKVAIEKFGMATQNTWKAYADEFVVRGEEGQIMIELSQHD
jgi:hypothetical protein